MAFILGFPANEIVIPIIMMGYLATGTLQDFQSLDSLRALLNFRPDVEIVGCGMALDADVLPEPERPYESMARRLVCSSFNGGAERRAERAAELARLLRADGAVYFCHWGCKQTSGAAQLVKRRLEAAGFPTLVLDGDGCDSGNVNDGQMVTRLQAFLELLEGCR